MDTRDKIIASTELFLKSSGGDSIENASAEELHCGLSRAVMAAIADKWSEDKKRSEEKRRAFYFSAEFLVGRAIYNNLACMGLGDMAKRISGNEDVFETIGDQALGNGGLGRLAACFLDSAATLGLPLDGYGIRYKAGIFKQAIEDGYQREYADEWERYGDPWSVCRKDETVTVRMAGTDVLAVPYDMPVIGYGGRIGTLRLWQAESSSTFDFNLFDSGKYDRAVRTANRAEDITRVLYPNDNSDAGKLLRLKQQYFFCSASIADIIRQYKKNHNDGFSAFSQHAAIQLNDTHPVISIPELIRQLGIEGVDFDDAFRIAGQVFNYTNHTVMQEALEKWDMKYIRRVCPEVAKIIVRIDGRLKDELQSKDVPAETAEKMRVVIGGTVHMANLAVYVCAHTNGVARIHTEILKADVLKNWYAIYPDRFLNITNGITQRRWLLVANKELSGLVTELVGDGWITDLSKIDGLKKYAQDSAVLDRYARIKADNHRRLASYANMRSGVRIDPDTVLDVQIKRIHEYKRQLLNILCILELYFEFKDGTLGEFRPTTFIFGGKSAPGYFRAKGIIKLINEVAALINRDEQAKKLLNVVFLPDYNVSYAEKIIPAADVSVQISTAGTEASGTGNMKFMLNGAVTFGTYDGANIEIVQQAGEENNYIFGARVEDIAKLGDGYDPRELYNRDHRIKRVIDALTDGTLDDGGNGAFEELSTSLLYGAAWHKPDNYYLLLDFADCLETRKRLNSESRDSSFIVKRFINTASAGYFSSDRSIAEYAQKIWNITQN